ncbi:hypothetical protein CYMTET_51759 [Cymbomonas tetramitiformis]|uniref:Copper type II ascorbate-dependent monooxygenase C-terminal domain-containing protein n=1 Tax=Cymbomonas tetramitiformis TaxID=36881 RepID=A0AAE0BLL4_9CHLO|nr:hypothetical protein CYMTET_51759 [Cymbomonas tetramitiformis]
MIVEDLTIPPGKEAVDVSVECVNGLEIPIQALAFRVHAHGLGVYNRLDRAGLGGIFGSNDVKLLQRTPQLPQTFESVNQTIVFQPGDRMRMTCRYNSTGMDHTVYDGDHNKDEMCGLYLMFTSDTPIPAMECSGYYDSPTTFSPKGNYGIALGSHALLPAKAAAERRRALPGSGKEKAPIGQIGGISLTPDGRTLVVFHRGDRQWGDDTFSDEERPRITYTKPIEEATIVMLDPDTLLPKGKALGTKLFYFPHGLTICSQGHYWLTDVGLHQAIKMDADGNVLLTVGTKLEAGSGPKHLCQQTALINTMMIQMKDLNDRVAVSEAASEKAVAQMTATAQSGDAELEALRKLPYVPYVSGNPFPPRPSTLESDMPQMYDLYNDKTYDALSKRTNSSMRYEQLVLAPSLSYLHDAVAHSESTLDWIEDPTDPPNLEDLAERIFAAHNTVKGVFALLSNRYTMIQLRAGMESDATIHGGADALRAKLAFIEEKVYAGTEGLVTDSVLTKWLKEFDNTKAKAVMNTHAKASAKTSTFRDRQGGGKGKGAGKGEGSRGNGKGGEGEEQKRGMASGWRQQRGVAMDYAWGSHAVDRGAAKALRSWGVLSGRQQRTAGVDACGDGAVSQHRRLGTSTSSTARIAGVPGAQTRNQQVEACDGLQRTAGRCGGFGMEARRASAGQLAGGLEDAGEKSTSKTEWHEHTVDIFASEISAQLPRYYAQWYDPGHGAVGAVAAKPPPKLAPGSRVEVYWPIDDAWYPGKVGDTDEHSMTRVTYDDGDVEMLDMHTERYRVVPPAKGEQANEWDAALEGRWRSELGNSSLTELAVQMQGAALQDTTLGNYRPKAAAFMHFCVAEGRSWLPATEATVRLYIAHLMSKGTIRAASLQPYLSAVNNYHEDMGFDGPAKGRSVSRAVKGMASLQVAAAGTQNEEETKSHIAVADGVISVVLHREKGKRHVRLKRRLTIPATGVAGLVQLLERWQSARDEWWQRTSSPCGGAEKDSYWRLPWEQGRLTSAQANDWPTSVAVTADGSFFVADGYCGSRVAHFDPTGNFLKDLGTAGKMKVPHSIVLDQLHRNLYVADRENGRVRVIDQHGHESTLVSFEYMGGNPYAISMHGSSLLVLVWPLDADSDSRAPWLMEVALGVFDLEKDPNRDGQEVLVEHRGKPKVIGSVELIGMDGPHDIAIGSPLEDHKVFVAETRWGSMMPNISNLHILGCSTMHLRPQNNSRDASCWYMDAPHRDVANESAVLSSTSVSPLASLNALEMLGLMGIVSSIASAAYIFSKRKHEF